MSDQRQAPNSVQIIHAIDGAASLLAAGGMALIAMWLLGQSGGLAAIAAWGAYACARWALHCFRQVWRGEWWL